MISEQLLFKRPTDDDLEWHQDSPNALAVEVKRIRTVLDGVAHAFHVGDTETVARLCMHWLGNPGPLRQLSPAEYWREMGERDAEQDWDDIDRPLLEWSDRYGKVHLDPATTVIAAAAWRDGYVDMRQRLWENHKED